MTTVFKKFLPSVILLIVIFISAVADAAGLKIDKMKIYFDNGRPEITIKRHYPLKVYVEIGYTGIGLLEGYWEVDEEFLANVKKMIPSENKVVIESPKIPEIPTFVSGTHKIKFVITKPSQPIPFPWATYFVTTDEWESTEVKTPDSIKETPKCGE